MSSILRTVRLMKTISQYSRNYNYNKIAKCSLKCFTVRPYRLLSTQNVTENLPEDKSINQISSHYLDKTLYRLDSEVRRTGRIFRRDLDEIFNQIKKIGNATSIQGLILLRCCGSLLPEELQPARTELVTSVWNLLEELKCPLDVSHYNALLKIHLENEHKFSPTDFLSDMEKKGIQPNRVTYQRLIGRYCQDGDIDGASKILEFMKSKDLTINETVFNFLVMGYIKANNMENAKGILDIMKNAQLEPTADTYTTLACGYAKNGDIKEIMNILTEAQNNDVFLIDKNYLEIIRTLSENGYLEYIDEIIGKIKKSVGYNQDCINTILELINKELEDVAYKLLYTMHQPVVTPGNKPQIGQFFIRQLVKAERPLQKIIGFCQDLKSKGLNEVGLLKATESALFYQKIDHAIALIKEMNKEGLPIRCHYFWPLLLHYKKKNNEIGVYNILKLMEDLECYANYETFSDYAFPAINTLDENYVVEKLKDISNQPLNTFLNPLVNYYLTENDVQKAYNLVKKYPVRLNSSLVRTLSNAFKNSGDAKRILEILKTIIQHPEVNIDQLNRSDLAGQFLLQYLIISQNNVSGLEILLQEMAKMNLSISNNTADTILEKLKNELSEQAVLILEQIATDEFNEESDDHTAIPHPRVMNIEDLENHLTELKSKGLNTRGVLRRLMMMHCRKKNLERVIELKKEFDSQNSFYTGSIYAQLMELFVYHGKLDDALNCKSLLEKMEPDFPLDTHKVINLATLLIENDKYDDAIKLIEDHHKKFGLNKRIGEGLERNITRLLTTIADKGNVDFVKKMFEILVVKYNYTEVSNIVLGPLVKVHLINDNLDGAFEEFRRCAQNFKHTPFKNEICKKLVELEDSERLQIVVDLNTSIHGELNTLYDLICIFIESGRVQQARKIVETPGIRAHHKKIKSICERYVQLDMVKELEQFVKITKDIFDINRDDMYYYLICAYAKENNVQKALGVWTLMQEEDVHPSVQTLNFLGEFLKKNNEPVPFAIPSVRVDNTEETNALLRSIQAEDADQALEIKRNLENQGEKISVSLTSGLIEILLRKDRLIEAHNLTTELLSQKIYPQERIIKFLLGQLAKAGDVETISSMSKFMPPRLLRAVSFHNILCNAYSNSGRYLELLDELENDISKSKLIFPTGGILGILKSYPHVEERVIKLAERYHKEENFVLPKNMIWMHYFLQENYDKADTILESCPEMKDRLLFSNVLDTIRDTENETMGRKLIEIMKSSNASPTSKGAAFSGLMNAFIQSKQFDKAIEVLKEGQEFGLELNDFFYSTLFNLSNNLRSLDKPVPFELPPKPKRRGHRADSNVEDEEEKTRESL